MKILFGLTCVAAALEASHAATEAPIYLSENLDASNQRHLQSIQPATARILLAQRLGLSQFHSLGDIDESTLNLLREYGGEDSAIFGDGAVLSSDKSLYIIEGVNHPEDVLQHSRTPSLVLQNAPRLLDNARLVDDLAAQSKHVSSTKPVVHIQHLTQLQGLSRSDGDRYISAIDSIKSVLGKTDSASQNDHTIILMPPQSSKPLSKKSPYGSYSVPSTHRSSHDEKFQAQKRQRQEEPLEAPSPSPSFNPAHGISHLPSWLSTSEQEDGPLADTKDDDSTTTPTPSTSPLPKGVLRICHPSHDDAVSSTNNCSGHGKVYLRATGLEKFSPDCYACKCEATKLTFKSGKTKTIHWGGPACQKKDVSMQFWLLGGVTVGLVAIVAWGIGLLVSMGSEELPGVIGAGVAGPTASK